LSVITALLRARSLLAPASNHAPASNAVNSKQRHTTCDDEQSTSRTASDKQETTYLFFNFSPSCNIQQETKYLFIFFQEKKLGAQQPMKSTVYSELRGVK